MHAGRHAAGRFVSQPSEQRRRSGSSRRVHTTLAVEFDDPPSVAPIRQIQEALPHIRLIDCLHRQWVKQQLRRRCDRSRWLRCTAGLLCATAVVVIGGVRVWADVEIRAGPKRRPGLPVLRLLLRHCPPRSLCRNRRRHRRQPRRLVRTGLDRRKDHLQHGAASTADLLCDQRCVSLARKATATHRATKGSMQQRVREGARVKPLRAHHILIVAGRAVRGHRVFVAVVPNHAVLAGRAAASAELAGRDDGVRLQEAVKAEGAHAGGVPRRGVEVVASAASTHVQRQPATQRAEAVGERGRSGAQRCTAVRGRGLGARLAAAEAYSWP